MGGEIMGETDDPPTFKEALATWANIGLLSFGGPTAQIALMHRIIVDEKKGSMSSTI